MTNTDVSMVVLNNSTQKDSTKLYVYKEDDEGNSIDNFMSTIHSVTSTPEAFVRVTNKLDPNQFILFQITDVSKNTGNEYWTIDITNQHFQILSPLKMMKIYL